MQKLKIIIGLAGAVLCLNFGKTQAQGVEFSGSPTSIISNSAIIPEGKKLFYTSGLTAFATDASLPEGDYAKYGDTKTQALGILKKLKEMLEEKGLKMSNVFAMKVFIAPDVKTKTYDFDGWNAAYKMYFGTPENPIKPVRATLGISTLVNANKFIEIELIAVYP
ncbi:Rid family hydrolase [Emticicia sp. W12TSBA100-4]|uniref:Rid family hydrolase n=1 Tax=Emticicia sp. W12TSBA100-4 TaxID=3160965 RepID=UPI0033056CEB